MAFLIITICLNGFVNFFAWRAKLDHDREFEGEFSDRFRARLPLLHV